MPVDTRTRVRRFVLVLAGLLLLALELTLLIHPLDAKARASAVEARLAGQLRTDADEPTYVVKAINFHAADETGNDRFGSDEPYWIFTSIGGEEGTANSGHSPKYEDVDSGDTEPFHNVVGCLWGPESACFPAVAPHGIAFAVQLWEADGGSDAKIVLEFADEAIQAAGPLLGDSQPEHKAWIDAATKLVRSAIDKAKRATDDDFVSRQVYTYQSEWLQKNLPNVGDSLLDQRAFVGPSGDGFYVLRIRISHITPKPETDYTVTVTTGGIRYGGTDANVFITLFGAMGASDENLLDVPSRDDFERGNTDNFDFPTADVGDLQEILIRHDNAGRNAGWYVERLQVRNERTGQRWNFPVDRWLATDECEGALELRLTPDTLPPAPGDGCRE